MKAALSDWNTGKLGIGLILFIFTLLAGCSGGGGGGGSSNTNTGGNKGGTPTTAVITSILVSPSNITLQTASTSPLTAIAYYSDGTSADISAQASWFSANNGIATVNASGLVAGATVGTTQITASFGAITSNAVGVTVISNLLTQTGLTISPLSLSVPQGQIVTFSALATYSDGSSGNVSANATWNSSNPQVATVSATGMVTAVAPGTALISVSFNGFSATGALTVTAPTTGGGPLTGVTWIYGGTSNTAWSQVADPTVPNGGSVFQAALITASQNSTASFTTNVLANGNVTFYYKVGSEAGYDCLNFYIDGAKQNTNLTGGVYCDSVSWSGNVLWTQASFPVSAGTHTFMWEYIKDGSVDVLPDTAWISQVTLPVGGGGGTAIGTQMGGARQGIPLTLPLGTTSTFAGSGMVGSVDGIGLSATFGGPYSTTTDGLNLYVADSNTHLIRRINIATGQVTTIAGQTGVCGATDGIGIAAQFCWPYGITTDGTNLYVSDTSNNKIRQISIATGQVTTLAGSGMYALTDGISTIASFAGPEGITTDGANLYVADAGNNAIRQVSIATGQVVTLAGQGAAMPGSLDGFGTSAQFNYPRGITTDGINLYVTDQWNYTIRQINIATAQVTTLAGQAGMIGNADGFGTLATFDTPWGITTDGTNLYIAEAWWGTVRKIVIATGQVVTIAGIAGTWGSVDGPSLNGATFNYPVGITTDGASLFVVDAWNYNIRRIQ